MVPDSRQLIGTYRTPRFKYGQKVTCEARGEVTIVGVSAGRIPWPLARQGRGTASHVVYRDLARAVKRETNLAVCHWWGVTGSTVWKWRKALGVPRVNEGTRRFMSAHGKSAAGKPALLAMYATLKRPERAAKIAAAMRGKPRPPKIAARLPVAFKGRRHSAATRAKMRAAHKGTIPPAAGIPWTAAENELLRTMPAAEVAKRTGRTLTAVYSQRNKLGISDGRTTRHKRQL